MAIAERRADPECPAGGEDLGREREECDPAAPERPADDPAFYFWGINEFYVAP